MIKFQFCKDMTSLKELWGSSVETVTSPSRWVMWRQTDVTVLPAKIKDDCSIPMSSPKCFSVEFGNHSSMDGLSET